VPSVRSVVVRMFPVALISALTMSQGLAQDATGALRLRFTTFSVPGSLVLGVESINSAGTIVGYYSDSAGNSIGFQLPSGGAISTLVDPLDTATPGFTEANGINNAGTIVGQFYDAAATTYSGFFLTNGAYTTYDVPNEPQFTTTALLGLNNRNGFCGFVFPPPYTAADAFVSSNRGAMSIFAVNGSTTNECTAMNDSGSSVGIYEDSTGLIHGWMRDAAGAITVIDVPGASTTPAAVPCLGGSLAGTVPNGINNRGEITGHFWDTSNNEHGFIRSPNGTFTQVDVPGAYQTAGGGVNENNAMVGHYTDTSCVSYGYTVKF